MNIELINGDCLSVLSSLFLDNSVDSIVTDPPYGLSKEPDIAKVMQHWIDDTDYMHTAKGFMGKTWDSFVPGPKYWRECYRVLKPGGHMLVFAGTRTQDLMGIALRFAGFEIRDCLVWLQGQGFPKSLNVTKTAIETGHACDCKALPEHDVRPVQQADLSASVDTENERGEILQPRVPEQSASSLRAQGRSNVGRDESLLARRSVHRAGKGLPDDSNAVASEGSAERLRAGTPSRSGENAGQTAETGRGSPPHQSQSLRQSSGEPESLPESQSALDGTPFPRCAKCQRQIIPEGLGSALKPALEPILLVRKPLSESTVAKNVLKWGTGGINVDGCRIGTEQMGGQKVKSSYAGTEGHFGGGKDRDREFTATVTTGRFPSNLLLDETAAAMLDEQTGDLGKSAGGNSTNIGGFVTAKSDKTKIGKPCGFGDSGGASRFFYVAKASRREKNAGLGDAKCSHPTVKPLTLMRYLCRLITPPGGTILDPFMGSGSTGCAAMKEDFSFIGIEREMEYVEIAKKRIK